MRVIGSVQLGVSDVSMCVIEPVFITKQPRQLVMKPKQDIVPIESGCNPKGHLEMVNRLLRIAVAESAVRFGDLVLFAFLWEEVDCAECRFFCGVELIV